MQTPVIEVAPVQFKTGGEADLPKVTKRFSPYSTQDRSKHLDVTADAVRAIDGSIERDGFSNTLVEDIRIAAFLAQSVFGVPAFAQT